MDRPGTVDQRLDVLEDQSDDAAKRLEALEANAGIGDGAARLDEITERLNQIVDIVVKFLTHVGEVYPEAGEDLKSLQALDLPAVVAARQAESAARRAEAAAARAEKAAS